MDGLAAACRLRGPRRHHRAALARAGQAPERAGVRRPVRLDRRLGHHRRAADGRPHARRPHDARLAPGHHRGRSSPTGTARWASTSASAASPASATSSSSARRSATSTRPASAPTTACRASASRPRHGRHARRPDDARASTSARSPACSPTPATRAQFSVIVVTSSSGHELFEVVAPVYRGGGVPSTLEARRKQATGWIVGLFDAEPILRDAVGRQTGVAVTLERDHVADPGLPDPDRRRRRVPDAVGDHAEPVGRALRPPRRRRPADASACRSRPTAAGTSPSPAPSRAAWATPRSRPRSCS